MKAKKRWPSLMVFVFLLYACSWASQVQGRFIVYIEPATASRLHSSEDQALLLAEWARTLNGTVRLERTLVTGAWVISVLSAGDATKQMLDIQRLRGVGSVERDTLLRHP